MLTCRIVRRSPRHLTRFCSWRNQFVTSLAYTDSDNGAATGRAGKTAALFLETARTAPARPTGESNVIQTRVVRITPILPLLLAVVGCGWLAEFEHPETYHESYQAAVDASHLGEGRFIPELLPRSARDLRETHDIDTNEAWVAFRYTPGDSAEIRSVCAEGDIRFARRRWSLGIPWWPKWLVRESRKDVPPGYLLLRCPRETRYATGRVTKYTAYAAIDDRIGQGYFWHD